MAYDLYFHAPSAGPRPTAGDIATFLSKQPFVRVEGKTAHYLNERTGLGCELELETEESDALVELHVQGPVPHVLAYEIEPLLAAMVQRFALEVYDPQAGGMGRGAYDCEKFLEGFSFLNRFLHEVQFGHLGKRPPPSYPRAALEAVWRWNGEYRRAFSDDARHFATIYFTLVEGVLGTLVLLTEAHHAIIPDADWVLTVSPDGAPVLTRFAALHTALAPYERRDGPIRHWLVERGSDALTTGLFSGERRMPELVPTGRVLTKEILDESIAKICGAASALERVQNAAFASNQGRYRDCLELSRGVEGDYALIALGIHGNALGELAQFDEAIEALQHVVARMPDDAMWRNCLAFFLARDGREAEARTHYEKALATLDAALGHTPNDPTLLGRKAYALNGLGRSHDALTAAARAIAVNDAHTLGLVNAGRALLDLGDCVAARSLLTRATKSDPKLPQPKLYLAIAHARCGDTNDAKALIEEIAEACPNLRAIAEEDEALGAAMRITFSGDVRA